MKTIVQMAVAAGLLFAAATSPVSVAQNASPPPASTGQSDVSTELILRGSDILNAKVFSQQGEELGHVRDFLLEPKTGNISHAVLGMGGWQGIGEKFAIVPWNLIKQDQQKAENYILQADREKFRTAPTFERDQWATVLQPGYLTKVQQHFSAPAVQPQQQQQQQLSQQPAPPSPPDVSSEPKAAPESQQKRQAQQRPRKETPQAEQKQRHSSKSSGTVGTDDNPK